MTTTTPHPPTTLHESTPLTPSSAESFLSAFLADASQKPNQNEIVLTNLLRVQQALAGVYVPPPPPPAVPVAAETEVLAKREAGMGEIIREGAGEGECGERVDGEEKVEVVPEMAAAEAGGVDGENRRENRKERKAKRRREEGKAKEKEKKRIKREKERGERSE